METPHVQARLRQLLDENAQFALDARGTTNHCPMALVALARMGASPERLQDFFKRWTQTYALRETHREFPVAGKSWLAQLGVPAAFSSLRKHFLESIGASNPAEVLREVISRAPFAPATGAFHALIRIGYGLESGHAGEIAAGLAAYVSNNLTIDVEWSGREAARSVEDGLAVLSGRLSGRTWPGSSITSRLKAVAADPDFEDALRAPPMSPAFLDDIARAAIELYWQTANFTVLHMVTGTYAARSVLAQLPEELAGQLGPSIWTAFCAAFVSVGAPKPVSRNTPEISAGWPEILKRATESQDDHVIKMVYTCFRESRRDPDSPYLASASRILRARQT